MRVANWCRKNPLTMNLDETKFISPMYKSRSSFLFTYNDAHIDYCNEYKYLGVWFMNTWIQIRL